MGVRLDFTLVRRSAGAYAVAGTTDRDMSSGRVELWGYAPGANRARRLASVRVRDGVWSVPNLRPSRTGRWEFYARYKSSGRTYADDVSECGTIMRIRRARASSLPAPAASRSAPSSAPTRSAHGRTTSYPADRPVSGLGAGEQLGAPVRRIGAVLGKITVDEQVSNSLHALPGHPHPTADLRHAPRLVQARPSTCHHADVSPPSTANTWAASISRALSRNMAMMTSVSDRAGFGRGWRAGQSSRGGTTVSGPGDAHAALAVGLKAGKAAGSPLGRTGLRRHPECFGRQAKASQRRAGELHRRLRAGGDEVAVDNRTFVEIAMRRPHTRWRPGTRRQHWCGGDWSRRPPRARPALRHRWPQRERRRRGIVRRQPQRHRHRLRPTFRAPGRISRLLAAGSRSSSNGVGQDAKPTHGGDRLRGFGNRDDVPGGIKKTTGAQLNHEVADLPVGESVVDGEVDRVRVRH